MRLHPRTKIVNVARCELESYILDWIQKHDLTWIEAIRSLLVIVSSYSVYPLREERHPDNPEKKADEE